MKEMVIKKLLVHYNLKNQIQLYNNLMNKKNMSKTHY